MMVALLGEGFVQGGRMAVKFIKPVYAGDTLTVYGVVRDKTPDEQGRIRVAVEVWCENEEGVKTMVGEASGLARSDA
jgi:acyl dehydratase